MDECLIYLYLYLFMKSNLGTKYFDAHWKKWVDVANLINNDDEQKYNRMAHIFWEKYKTCTKQ